MTNKTEVLISLLKKTNSGPTSTEEVSQEAKVPIVITNNLLIDIYKAGLIEFENDQVDLSSDQRVNLAIHAINQGTDVEKVCKVLEWKEFENFTAKAFEKNDFKVKRNFRFKAAQRRWEIDVLAYSYPIIVCVDCKRWKRGWNNSAITRVANAQSQRTKVLANSLDFLQNKIELENWKQATLFPIILSLFPGPVKFYNRVPVVPILKLQNFIDEFQGYKTELLNFHTKLSPKLTDYNKINSLKF